MSEQSTFNIPAILVRYAPLKDGGMTVSFHTQEVDHLDQLALMQYYQKFGWLQFSEVESMSVPKEPIDRASGERSRAETARRVLYRLWENSDQKDTVSAEEYYRKHMDNFIDQLKERLPER